MHQTFIMLFLMVAFLLSSTSNLHQVFAASVSSSLPKPHQGLNALLFYTCVTHEVLNQCNESFTMDQSESANLGFTSNLTTVDEGFKVGIKSLYAVHDIFFDNEKHTLRTNWKAVWSSTQQILKSYIDDGKIIGFFIGDELFPGKIPLQDFLTALKAVDAFKQEFADKKLITWENEGGTNWVEFVNKELDGKLPAELDIFSIDDYSMNASQHKHFHETVIYPMLHPHQKIYLVPGSYATRAPVNISKSEWCCYGSKFSDCDSCMVERIERFYNWAAKDARVIGFAPWHWDSRDIDEVTPYKEVGTVDMPATRKLWIEISKLMQEGGK